MWLHSLKVAQLLRSAACLQTNQSRSYLNHLVNYDYDYDIYKLRRINLKIVSIADFSLGLTYDSLKVSVTLGSSKTMNPRRLTLYQLHFF